MVHYNLITAEATKHAALLTNVAETSVVTDFTFALEVLIIICMTACFCPREATMLVFSFTWIYTNGQATVAK